MRTKLITIGVSVLALVAVACSAGESDTAGPGAQEQVAEGQGKQSKGEKTIVMEVTGPKTADITYSLGSDQSQENGAKLPWRKELTSKESFLFPTISAQSMGSASGEIECKITIDGELVKENASSGEFAIVTCTADDF
ncbi:MmpS family transport accessory protein [Salinispora arenicola]|uniref:MmpS family transport accessory protein n=1 Tax=Salinispora arenicola TaxID=168697 RepID=UPI001E4EEAFA|nr:MmpS family transport accessory protein [Salinispora arenicola]